MDSFVDLPSYPGVRYRLRKFRPFDEPERRKDFESFTEFHGTGKPGSFGQPGDVYLNLDNIKLYHREKGQWVPWDSNPNGARKGKYPHPEHSNRFVWVQDRRIQYVSWDWRSKIIDQNLVLKSVVSLYQRDRLKRKADSPSVSLNTRKGKKGRLSVADPTIDSSALSSSVSGPVASISMHLTQRTSMSPNILETPMEFKKNDDELRQENELFRKAAHEREPSDSNGTGQLQSLPRTLSLSAQTCTFLQGTGVVSSNAPEAGPSGIFGIDEIEESKPSIASSIPSAEKGKAEVIDLTLDSDSDDFSSLKSRSVDRPSHLSTESSASSMKTVSHASQNISPSNYTLDDDDEIREMTREAYRVQYRAKKGRRPRASGSSDYVASLAAVSDFQPKKEESATESVPGPSVVPDHSEGVVADTVGEDDAELSYPNDEPAVIPQPAPAAQDVDFKLEEVGMAALEVGIADTVQEETVANETEELQRGNSIDQLPLNLGFTDVVLPFAFPVIAAGSALNVCQLCKEEGEHFECDVTHVGMRHLADNHAAQCRAFQAHLQRAGPNDTRLKQYLARFS